MMNELIYELIEAAQKDGWDILNGKNVHELLWWMTVHGDEN